jgi:hypothetical protein
VASSELPMAFYTGTLTASLAILMFSVLLWLVIARQIKRLITRPIHNLEELSRQVTREENYALRASRGNTTKSAAWPKPSTPCFRASKPASSSSSGRPRRFQAAYDQAQGLAEETRHTNRKLELEVQVRSKIEKSSPASRTTSTASSTPCPRH